MNGGMVGGGSGTVEQGGGDGAGVDAGGVGEGAERGFKWEGVSGEPGEEGGVAEEAGVGELGSVGVAVYEDGSVLKAGDRSEKKYKDDQSIETR